MNAQLFPARERGKVAPQILAILLNMNGELYSVFWIDPKLALLTTCVDLLKSSWSSCGYWTVIAAKHRMQG